MGFLTTVVVHRKNVAFNRRTVGERSWQDIWVQNSNLAVAKELICSLKAAFAQSILNVKSILRLVNMVPVVAVCLTTVFSCVKNKKFVVCMAYLKNNSATTIKKLRVLKATQV